MLNSKSNALKVAEATLGKITKAIKPRAKFIMHIVELWLGMCLVLHMRESDGER